MSLKQVVANAVDTAFLAVGDLAVDATLHSVTVTGYDLLTDEKLQEEEITSVKVILVDSVRQVDNLRVDATALASEVKAYIKTTQTPLSLYSKLVIGEVSFLIQSFTDFEGITELVLRKV